jgi:hypothetical protein
VYILIIDPRNDETCKHLAESDLKRDPKTVDTDQRIIYIKKELLATILNMYAWKKCDHRLRIHLGLHRDISLFRVDLTDKSAISSRPGERDLAVRYSNNSDFYRSFYTDMMATYDNAFQLPFDVDGVEDKHLNKDLAKRLLSDLGIDLGQVAGIGDKELEEIVEIARKPENPYPA